MTANQPPMDPLAEFEEMLRVSGLALEWKHLSRATPAEFDGYIGVVLSAAQKYGASEYERGQREGTRFMAETTGVKHQHGDDCKTVMAIRNTTIDEGVKLLHAYADARVEAVLAEIRRCGGDTAEEVMDNVDSALRQARKDNHNDRS